MSETERLEEAKRLLEEAMGYVRTFGASGSAPIIHDPGRAGHGVR